MLKVKLKKSLTGFNLDIDFSADRETLAILGPSGSGKTMTLQCISGLLKPDEGYIELNDQVLFDSSAKINLPAKKRKVGFVFQNYALFPHLTVKQNILYGIKHLTEKEQNERANELLEKINIPSLGNRYPRQLSAGQQQRVAVARALAPEPDVLLLDEPFSALDSLVKERLQLELQSLQRFYHGSILFVTHDLAEGYKLASRIAVYNSGHIIQCDAKKRVIDSPANHAVARLTGTRNLFKGIITELNEKDAIVSVPEMDVIIKVDIKEENDFVINQPVTIGIRPEYVHLSSNHVENTLNCVVDRIIEGVSSAHCFFYLKGRKDSGHWIEAILSKSNMDGIEVGQEYLVHLHPDHFSVFND